MPRWGMVIDLDKCTGCGACVAACRVENNVPSAGPREAARSRAIFWMELITSFEGEHPHLKTRILPRPCFHCDNPPCTKVCPVRATYKNDEGIVAQIYHRCIGCRYCVNNCPYGAKFFNWYTPHWPAEYREALNPDVSVRTKGVVEKCTFCHHRLLKAREKAKVERRELAEGDYVPACVQTCPAQAISFGDLDDRSSRVTQLAESSRAFRLLADLGTQPKVIYLTEGEWHA
ncbi:MAG: 4Fe-4S dicluster domain-containing protein [bacterium]